MRRAAFLLALATLAVPGSAAAQQLRFTTTAPGGVASTGNTLGLAKQLSQNGPGVEDSIGTFLALDPQSVDGSPANPNNPWPLGTTNDWSSNGSEGTLVLPPRAEVLYAELVWGGSTNYGGENVIAFLDDPVTIHAGGNSMAVAPDPQSAITIAETSYQLFAANYYIRSADVTAFVQQHGAGVYGVGGVPGTQHELTNTLAAAGWSLVVAYRQTEQPIRNLSVFVGGSFVDEDSQQDYFVSGFCAPPFGPVEGAAVLAALEGDANRIGDELLVAATDVGPFVALSGPNNPVDNFFASQINDGSGNLDLTGTFGTENHDAFTGVQTYGGRQGWDHTTVPLSSQDGHLQNGQTSAVVRTNTTGDSFVPVLVALELDVKSPDFTGSGTEAMPPTVEAGDVITVTATLTNGGEAPATNLTFVLPLDGALELASYDTDGMPGDSGGAPVTETDLTTGVDAGVLDVGETRVIEMTFEAQAAPDNGTNFVFQPMWHHSFVVCDGDAPIAESYMPPGDTVAFDAPMGNGGGGSGGSSGAGGDGGAGGTGPGGDGEPDDDIIEEDGSCGCDVPARRGPGGALALLFGFGALAMRRRRGGPARSAGDA
jgi:uncharacterized repeat protein (TIGR01451 family)